jgi:hypothetical protein
MDWIEEGHVKISVEIGFRVSPFQCLLSMSVMPYMILLALGSLVKKLFMGLVRRLISRNVHSRILVVRIEFQSSLSKS